MSRQPPEHYEVSQVGFVAQAAADPTAHWDAGCLQQSAESAVSQRHNIPIFKVEPSTLVVHQAQIKCCVAGAHAEHF